MSTFEVGSMIEVETMDGVFFRGRLTDFADDYVLVDGLGFPLTMVKALRHA